MSTPETSSKRPWGWIAVAGLLAAGIVGLGIYAIGLDSDLDDANAQIASQQKKIASQQEQIASQQEQIASQQEQIASQQEQIEQADNTGARAVAATKAAYEDLSAQLGAAEQDASQAVEQAAGTLEQAEQAAAEAKGTAEEVQKEVDAAQAKAETAATCAQSFLSAFSGVFSGATLKEGVEATVTELQALQPQCAPALGQDGSGS